MAGLRIPNTTWAGIADYFDRVAGGDGTAFASSPGRLPSVQLRGMGLLCRLYLGRGPRNPVIREEVIALHRDGPQLGCRGICDGYHAAQAVIYTISVDPETADRWYDELCEHLLRGQDPDGSWPIQGDPWGDRAGQVGVTSLALLTLELQSVRSRQWRRSPGAIKDEAIRDAVK
jgi:hypothetical protein